MAKKKKLVDAYTADRAKLVSKGSEKRAQRHTELAGVANQVRAKLRQFTGQRQTFLAMQDEVKDMRGKMRLEGKEYIVADGDVMHFRCNT